MAAVVSQSTMEKNAFLKSKPSVSVQARQCGLSRNPVSWYLERKK